jgi:regulator of RNase E activity RraA
VVVVGVSISPGDVVVGDVDGVVVPRVVAETVLRAAEDRVGEEDRVPAAIREGDSPLEAYEEYGSSERAGCRSFDGFFPLPWSKV